MLAVAARADPILPLGGTPAAKSLLLTSWTNSMVPAFSQGQRTSAAGAHASPRLLTTART